MVSSLKANIDQTMGDHRKPLIAYRYYIMFMILLTMMVIFSARCSLNVAIIAMVGNQTIKVSDHWLLWTLSLDCYLFHLRDTLIGIKMNRESFWEPIFISPVKSVFP